MRLFETTQTQTHCCCYRQLRHRRSYISVLVHNFRTNVRNSDGIHLVACHTDSRSRPGPRPDEYMRFLSILGLMIMRYSMPPSRRRGPTFYPTLIFPFCALWQTRRTTSTTSLASSNSSSSPPALAPAPAPTQTSARASARTARTFSSARSR